MDRRSTQKRPTEPVSNGLCDEPTFHKPSGGTCEIRVPDSAHNTDLETISESDLADDVGMNGEGGFLDGWEEGAVNPGS